MRQVITTKFSIALAALLFSIILASCGGGTQNAQAGANDVPPTGGGNTPPQNDPLPPTTQSVSLSWMPPLYNTDGSSLSDLRGHNIYMKTGSGNFVKIYTLNTTAVATHVVENLGPGTYTFAVTAFNTDGVESSYSQTVTITL